MHLVKRSSRHLPPRGEDCTNLAGLTKDAISTLLILTDASRREGNRGMEAPLLNFQPPCVLHLQPPRGRLTSSRLGSRRQVVFRIKCIKLSEFCGPPTPPPAGRRTPLPMHNSLTTTTTTTTVVVSLKHDFIVRSGTDLISLLTLWFLLLVRPSSKSLRLCHCLSNAMYSSIGQNIKSLAVSDVRCPTHFCVFCVCVRALSRSQFLTNFDEIWHRRLEPKSRHDP